jgi:HSP90 family molecular chaperone
MWCVIPVQEYAQEDKVKALVERFSLFTQYPIKLLMEKEVRLTCESLLAEQTQVCFVRNAGSLRVHKAFGPPWS